ncbi:G-type lectin S-receptor-like serine/threonine-protein kinase SD2-2 [Diospyros lotus]|uniref:G-type lectin S-receptor-like serine/threonine-protein kinase SD2-2 n=1 Tax=Diospyros lotus TaxID=55363 RepID=UPI0022554FEA|nr:G-type lectin S-receptor-like serine/threonine-protein kinase SD2-2 [Diospyros lotus]
MSPYFIWFMPLLLLAVTGKLVSSSNSASEMAEPGIDRDSKVSSWPTTRKLESYSGGKVIISGNATILSENGTFRLGFFNSNGEARWYLGIWYAFILTPTYVWVANREAPLKNLSAAEALITEDGKLGVRDSGGEIVWATENGEAAAEARLLEAGDLVLLGRRGGVVWRSFDHPTDTWLPGMNLSVHQKFTCWKNSGDPAPGNYSLRLKPPEYGEIELVFNGTKSYWSTGKWIGNSFSSVPEMTIRYIYKFYFTNPFTPMASFGYIEVAPDNGMQPPLTRFQLDFSGQLQQYSWSQQIENWNIFWSQPENLCRVYGLCGNLGFCNTGMSSPCKCLPNFHPVDHIGWNDGDFSGGCHHDSHAVCESSDGFEEVGAVSFDGGVMESFSGRSRGFCEKTCLSNCSCVGIYHNVKTNTCKNLYGSLLNLQNSTPGSTIDDILYVRVPREGTTPKTRKKTLIFIGICCSFLAIITFMLIALLLLRSKIKRKKQEEDEVFSVTNLRVFSYKELNAATRGFSEKIGHGGFGAVFRGELSDSSLVAVKRLERPGGAEREFRAEVCTIGNIQHVNLVRLRGFCSENPRRLLVYDYMPNGPLSGYLKQDGQNLSWDVRLRVAIGTARGIAYLHEECRDCIIHCDIKPENILLDEDFLPKVSDFGLAKLIGRDFSRVLATMRGTWGYVAPEWISGLAITAKADVYSYGMTLLELLGGRRNVTGPPSTGGGGTGEKWFFPPWAAQQIIEGNVAAVVDERLAGAYDAAEAARLGLVAVWCIQDEEAMRPTMGMVVKMLEGVVEVAIPSPPKLLQALVSGESFHGVGTDSGDRELTSSGCSNNGLQVSGNSADSPNYLSTMA